jgi:hypothetical protein
MELREFENTAFRYGVPGYMIDGLYYYVYHRLEPGGFLQAVLSNDLMEAFGRADEINRNYMFNYVDFLYNEVTSECWGSPEKVNNWLSEKGV